MNHRLAHMYNVSKINEANVPLTPIASGIGSTPHKLVRPLAKEY